MMKRFRYLALAGLVAFAACDEEGAVDPVVQTGTVNVSVTAGAEGPIQGVQVALAGATSQSAATGTDGMVSFGNVQAGNYAVTISGVSADFACATTSQSVTVVGGQTTAVTFTCSLVQTASISGSVTRGAEPLPGAAVTIQRAGGSLQFGQSGPAGQYSFTGLRSGQYEVRLTPPEGVSCPVTLQNVTLQAGQSQIVNFVCEPEPEQLENPVVTIQSITREGTTTPADPDALAGRVEVTVNIDPRGNDLAEYRLAVRRADGTFFEICRQTFATGAPEPVAGVQGEFTITCSWATDRLRTRQGSSPLRTAADLVGPFSPIGADPLRPHHPIFLNGEWELIARVVPATEADPAQAAVTVTTVNEDALLLGVRSHNANWDDPNTGQPFPDWMLHPTTGLRWVSGDIHVTVFPAIFSVEHDPNDPFLTTGRFSFAGFRDGASTTVGGGDLSPAADGTFPFVFCEAPSPATATDGSPCYARVNNFITGDIGARELRIQTLTQFGQFGPGLTSVLNNLKTVFFFDQDLQSGTRGTLNDVLRIDNEGPSAPGIALRSHPVPGFSRSGQGRALTAGGWINWVYDFHRSGGYSLPANDNPNTFPANPDHPDGLWCDPAGDLCRAAGTAIAGIGRSTSGTNRQIYHVGPDAPAGLSASAVVPGLGDETGLIQTGADLTPETDSPGLVSAGSAEGTPFSDTETDYAVAGRSWDLFGNARNTDVALYIGVDGNAPVFAEDTPVDPTDAGSVWNAYGAIDAFGAPKTPGQYTGTTTDTGQGFSGVAGIEIVDRELGCATGVLSCTGTARNFRGGNGSGQTAGQRADADGPTAHPTGKKAQVAGGTGPLTWTFDAMVAGAMANDIVATVGGAALLAYDAPFAPPQPLPEHDGYRVQHTLTWDRAGNSRESVEVTEHIADKSRPVVGNVGMPTITTFLRGQSATFLGEVRDQADLKKSDFAFDFNGITTLQSWDETANMPSPFPGVDVDGRAFAGTSLQLPLHNEAHTAFGSASILLHTDLSATVSFLTCVVRFDEAGAAPAGDGIHRPRGARWRSWNHASPYGLTNTQHSDFTFTSIPECPARADIIGGVTPSLGTADAWSFTVVDGNPTLTLSGPTGTFVPNVDGVEDVVVGGILSLYFLDEQGRAILLDPAAWGPVLVADTGAGALGRTYTWTFPSEALPEEAVVTTSSGAPDGFFFVLRRASTALSGTALIWDATSNP